MRGVDLLAQSVEADKVAPGTVGFIIVALLGFATWMLMRSMNRQIKKIDFPSRDEELDAEPGQDEEPRSPTS
jgi:hypothetical protein